MDKVSMLRRAVFTSGIEPSKAADLYERIIELLEEQRVFNILCGLGLGFGIGLVLGVLMVIPYI